MIEMEKHLNIPKPVSFDLWVPGVLVSQEEGEHRTLQMDLRKT